MHSQDAKAALAQRNTRADIEPLPGRKNTPVFSRFLYRDRNMVEVFFSKLKHFRAAATRYEKRDANYRALVELAPSPIWVRAYEPVIHRALAGSAA